MIRAITAGVALSVVCFVGAAMLWVDANSRSFSGTGARVGELGWLVGSVGLLVTALTIVLASSGRYSIDKRGQVVLSLGFAVLAASVGAFEFEQFRIRRGAERLGPMAMVDPPTTMVLHQRRITLSVGLAGAAMPLGIGLALLVGSRRKRAT